YIGWQIEQRWHGYSQAYYLFRFWWIDERYRDLAQVNIPNRSSKFADKNTERGPALMVHYDEEPQVVSIPRHRWKVVDTAAHGIAQLASVERHQQFGDRIQVPHPRIEPGSSAIGYTSPRPIF